MALASVITASDNDSSWTISPYHSMIISHASSSGLSLNASNSSDDDPCAYELYPDLTAKFFLITVFGSLVSVIGIFNNCLLFYVLTRSALIKTHVFYLCVLAACDIVTEMSYIAVMSMQILFDYAEDVALYRAWHNYVKWVFTITHIGLTVSAYMIVSASAERFLSTLRWLKRRSCTGRDRWMVTLAVVCFAICSKITVFWEMEVIYEPNCNGFGEYYLEPSGLARNYAYRTGFALWFRHVVHVFLPFILLILLNGSILLHLKRNPMEMHSALISLTLGDLVRQRKRSIRAATLMLGGIVTTYLISNFLNVIISIWEHIDQDYLRSLSEGKMYTFSADVISLLTIVTGCIRLPIYCACNKQLRKEICHVLQSWRHRGEVIAGFKRLFIKAKATGRDNEPNFDPLLENGDARREKTYNGIYDHHSLVNEHAEFTCLTSSAIV